MYKMSFFKLSNGPTRILKSGRRKMGSDEMIGRLCQYCCIIFGFRNDRGKGEGK